MVAVSATRSTYLVFDTGNDVYFLETEWGGPCNDDFSETRYQMDHVCRVPHPTWAGPTHIGKHGGGGRLRTTEPLDEAAVDLECMALNWILG